MPPRRTGGRLGGGVLALLAVALHAPALASDAGAACTWHVRLAYHYREAGPQGARDAQVLLALESPLQCTGSGAQMRLAPAGPTAARGRAHVSGNLPHAGGPAQLRDTYDKYLAWPAADSAGAPAPAIEVPAPSFVGEGFATRVSLAGIPVGEQHSGIADPDAAARDAAAAGDRRALHAVVDAPATADHLDLALYFDPLPGEPSDPAGTLAQVPQRTAEALKVPGGEAALALKGHLFGARTRYNSDGSFSICYQRSLVLAPAAVDVDFCGWLTRTGRDWVPEHLPPDDAPPAH